VRRVLKTLAGTEALPVALADPEPEPVAIDPFREVALVLAEQRQVARAARQLVNESRQEAVRASALKILAKLATDRIDVLDRFGALPTGPSWLAEFQAEVMFEALREVGEAQGIDRAELDELARERMRQRLAYEQSRGLLRLEA